MNRAIHFTRIDIRRMPGFPRGGLNIANFAPGINVVYGPNASGKTTLGRAMQRLLRPYAADGATDSLIGEVSIEDRLFEIDYHLGQVTCRSGGQEVSPPALAPEQVHQRNVLALHELVQQVDDRDIVAQILQEAAGGYDIAAAAQSLGFDRDRPVDRKSKVVRQYSESIRARKKAEKRLLEIDREALQLAELERRRDEAHRAQLRQAVIEKALDASAKQEKLELARQSAAAFPDAMSKLVGDEWNRLEQIKNKLASRREGLATAQASLEQAEADIGAAGLPADGVSAVTIKTLHGRCESLRNLTQEIGQLEAELQGATKRLETALAGLGPDVTPERANTLDARRLDKLFTFVRQAEESRLEGEALEKLTKWLEVVPPTDADVDVLRDGIALLQQWLADQRSVPPVRRGKAAWWIAAGVTAVAAGGMALVHVSWLLLLLPAAGLALWPLIRNQLAAAPATGPAVAEQWSGLGIDPPAAWSVPEVQTRLRSLQQQWAAAELAREKHERFADLRDCRQEYGRQCQAVDAEYKRWRQDLGIQIDLNDARLYRLADMICRIQEAQSQCADTEARLTESRRQSAQVLETINDELAPYVESQAKDIDEASALVRELEQRLLDHRDAVARRQSAQNEIKKCEEQISELEQDRESLFAKLGLSTGDEVTLRQWLDQREAYREAQRALHLATHDYNSAVAALAGHEDLLQQPREALETELSACSRRAASLKELDEQLGAIRGRIQDAKRETALEEALANEDSCLDELRSRRDDDVAQLVGNVLTSYLIRQQRDTQQPGVLRRAVELFARITHGRYRLRVEPGDPPRFRALDTSLGREQNLDELSSGTRLQLLLSVRVAFVEQQEQGVQLPFIFDETLGNSDEQRSQKIIEAAVELARSGRQVFYFTAQFDELAKWRRVLERTPDVPSREFDLARLRGFSETEYAPEVLAFDPPVASPIPAPEQDDWVTYGNKLKIPLLDRRSHIGDVHLWYLIDDVDSLYQLLRHDINKWGQLQTLVDIGSAEGLTRKSPVYLRAAASARLLEHLLNLWRQGRGNPIDRDVLEASRAVSETFMDEVTNLAQSLGGDARQLIEALRAGRVSRFRADRIDKLETYLLEHGYIDERPILDEAAIREAILPRVFADCEKGLLSKERVEQLISVVTHETTGRCDASD